MLRPHDVVALLVVVLVALLLAGCGGSSSDAETQDGPRPVTDAEAQVLATARFRNFDAGTRSFTTTLAINGQQVTLDGWVDFPDHLGYALATGDGFPSQLLRWDGTTLANAEAPADATTAPLPEPTDGWQSRGMDASASVLDSTLTVLLDLSDDRPENPLLLRQTGAYWIGTESLNGTDLTVYAAPPGDSTTEQVSAEDANLRLWLDETGLMHRVQLRLDGDWTDIDLATAEGVTLEPLS
ncbi:hypothetical protein [Nocardioides sp.]|uniref:hypothetical protein n=1 Tax=Nocardioides sp. TaxID=35761 RepID=UPI0039E546BE